MKNLGLFAFSLFTFFVYSESRDLFKQPAEEFPTFSQEYDASFEELKKPLKDHKKRVQPPKPNDIEQKPIDPRLDMSLDLLFTRPSADELREYGEKVEQQKIMKDGDVMKPRKENQNQKTKEMEDAIKKMDELDQSLVLKELGDALMRDLGEDNMVDRRNPIIPAHPEIIYDPYYIDIVGEEPKKIESKNNNNGNVNVNVNHVNVESTIVGVKMEGKDKIPPPPPPPPAPEPVLYRAPEYYPTSSSNYYYLNMNLADAVVFSAVLMLMIFLVRKTYLWIMKTPVATQPPVQPFSPPTYTPSSVVVETTKKVLPHQ